jgi:ubiquinone/menaquinone biosynthesis C-methylase UbiE
MPVNFSSRELSEKYDRFAHWYDWVEGVPELLGLGRLRPQMLRRLSGKGKVLEIAVGTGKNLRYYSHDCRIISMDISGEMLSVARKRAAHLSMDISFLLGDAEVLPFSDESFDSVVSSLSTCTFPNPVSALREMARVCKPEGRILLLEHGRSDQDWLGRWQDRREDDFAKRLGCHWNREPLEVAGNAGLRVVVARRCFFGIFHLIEAKPPSLQGNSDE